ncbi:HlyD family secretion protein [Solimonas variicoloris]|uniref:HlyD family secretion protein n=1 Tax=Solimonas variicoloris TaxID=254408 RepID=UPI000361C58B|nr:efflux RND transporter periplasmic adaptor subunit [Solimonas variicoloris]
MDASALTQKLGLRQHLPLYAMIAAALVIGAVVVWRLFFSGPSMPEGLLLANGRLEGDTVVVATKLPGRIAELKVREGDTVAAGQVLAQLEDAQLRAKLGQAQAAVAALEAQHQAAQTGLQALREQVPLQIAQADAAVRQARATLAKARAAAEQNRRDAQRLEELAQRGTAPAQRAELARLAAVAAEADAAAAEAAQQRGARVADEARLGPQRVRAQEDQVRALEAQLGQARAALAEAQSVVDDLTIRAPGAGVVTTRIRDRGEVVGAGGPLLEIVDLDRLYLKAYVPESSIGRLRLGLPAQIYTDALPDQPFAAKLGYIASRAEFTPKEVQTTDERVKLTYAVKLYLDANPEHRLGPGLPADAVIRWKDGVEWKRPHW